MAKTQVSKKSEKTEPKPSGLAPAPVFAPLTELRQRMDELFDDFSQGWRLPSLGRDLWSLEHPAESIHMPMLHGDQVSVGFDVCETDGGIEVSAELPGVDEKDVDVSITGGILTIKGEKKSEKEEKKKDYYRAERRFGSFLRSFRLPENVDEKKVKATFDRGVLEVSLPKRPEARSGTKKVAISKK